jgi:hypothetical protein
MSGDGLHIAIVRQVVPELGARFGCYSVIQRNSHEPLESPTEIDPLLPVAIPKTRHSEREDGRPSNNQIKLTGVA